MNEKINWNKSEIIKIIRQNVNNKLKKIGKINRGGVDLGENPMNAIGIRRIYYFAPVCMVLK